MGILSPLYRLVVLLALSAPFASASAEAPGQVPAAAAGGARVGMPYSEVRRRLLAAGYQPVVRPKDEFCGYADECKLPETEACAGAGTGQCSYRFRKGRTAIQVSGINGREGQSLSQTVNAITYGGY